MKNTYTVLLTLALVMSLAACTSAGGSTPAARSEAPATSQPASESPVTEGARPTTDRAGNSISVPEEINTIVSLAPAYTQILLDLGLTDKLVAVDTNSAALFPAVAGLQALDLTAPDLEQLLSLQPDILFSSVLSSEGGGSPFDPLVADGYCVATLPTPDNVQGVWEDVAFVAACVGLEDTAEDLIAEAKAAIEAVQSDLSEANAAPKTVLFEIASLPYIYSTGGGTYLNELIELAGGANVLASETGWLPVSEEAAVAADPQVIFTNVTYEADPVGGILARDGWQNVTAVANGNVYFIDNTASSLPNHHIADAVVEMARLLHPEVFGN